MKAIFFVVLFLGAGFAQTASTSFESADVHGSAPVANPNVRGGALRGGRFELRTATMVDLISYAYGMESNKVIGGPNWIDWDRFDVIAKAPPTTTQENLNLMLQNLLAERFKLAIHKGTKVMPAYALTVGKGEPKIKKASGEGETGCRPGQQQPPAPGTVPNQVITCHNVTMETFSNVLRDYAGGTYLADPVVDQTQLMGGWDFDLKFTARNRLPQAGADGITLFDAIDKQLGLKLEPAKLPLPVLFVDSANQTPTANAPGVAAKIPVAPPAEFEVATIKPTPPDVRGTNGRLQNGRLDLQNFTVKQLIQLAWDMPNNNDDMVVFRNRWSPHALTSSRKRPLHPK